VSGWFIRCKATRFKNQENLPMNKDLFESKWKQIRSQSNGWWSLITDYDLNKVEKANVKLNKYVTLLLVKYGYTREKAKQEIAKRVAEHETEQKGSVRPA
jgi:hypothetical protein